MKKSILFLITAILVIGFAGSAFSEENIGGSGQRKANPGEGFASGCAKSTNIIYMDLNNVRCPILMNGDMWWDAINDIARYEIPKGSGKTSQFAGAVWIGGLDAGGNLKLAAQTYRQSGVDYWPGPLDTATVSIDPQECLNYDQHWKLLKSDVQAFVNWINGNGTPGYVVPQAIQTWPGNGLLSKNEGHFLAPFNESIKLQKIAAGDTSLRSEIGTYDWHVGDYPNFDLSTNPTSGKCYVDGSKLYGDQNIWWVFNDEGNIHTETGGAPIGLEIRAQAFCFQTNNDINNCTFYNYQVINRSSNAVYDTWFGAWDDFDLGWAFDDYTGCDVGRGLGYGYNGEAFDPGTFGYGYNPPCVGQNFFQGPLADPGDGIDNNRNGQIDEPGEQIIMSQFVWYNNDVSVQGNPGTAEDYYNYMKGIWRDGTHMTYGGTGHGGSVACNFMFPDNSDPRNWGTNLGLTLQSGGVESYNQGPTPPTSDWTEVTAGDVPNDRRFLQSAGKFTLKAGAVNDIVRGVPWGRTTEGGPTASIPICQATSDDAQALFNNCFGITNGPDAPNMSIRELNQELILSITPWLYGNDSIETNYSEKDPYIKSGPDTNYYFQGYQIFQFANATVTVSDIGNPDLVVQIAQCDLKDSVAQIINEVSDPTINSYVATEEVNGANAGLQHTFDIRTDAFATGTTTLINHQTYYFCVLAYGYNAGEVCNDTFPPANGHCQPYISGRRNVYTYTAVPHIPDPQDGGLLLNSSYGDRPMVQRLEGTGNGGLVLDMTQGSINQALSSASNYRVNNPVYQSTGGPIDVSIYDPVAVGNYNFLVYLQDTTINSKWYITNTTTGETDSSDHTIDTTMTVSEKIFPQWGLRLSIKQVTMAGDPQNAPGSNGFLVATTQFADSTKQWLTGIPTTTSVPEFDWLFPQNAADSAADPKFIYLSVLGGTWGPYLFASDSVTGPAYPTATNLRSSSTYDTSLTGLASVNIVLTSDQSLWSRSVVIEEDASTATAEGNGVKGSPRVHASVDKNGMTDAQMNNYSTTDPNSPDFISATGMGWFPGYAINEESGERLNIMFGENSYLVNDNGSDMLFNPSSNIFTIPNPDAPPDFELGGMHYIYIMGHATPSGGTSDKYKITVAYDNCQELKARFDSVTYKLTGINAQIVKYSTWGNCMWVGLPLLVAGDTWLETADTIRLRVAKSYRNYNVGSTYNPYDFSPNQGIPYYSFSTNGLEEQTNQTAVAKNALDLINIVPNPYYAYSSYEVNQLSNDVKITNLPNICTVTIFTSSGTLVNTFNRNVPSSTDLTAGEILPATTNSSISTETSIDWNLTNFDGISIAGGVYIIHIQAPGLGERVIKWFGVIRPIDLQTF